MNSIYYNHLNTSHIFYLLCYVLLGHLDETWSTLFNTVTRVGHLDSTRTLYTRLAWNIPGYLSLIHKHNLRNTPPLLEEFRNFFIQQHYIADSEVKLNRQRLKNLPQSRIKGHNIENKPSNHPTREFFDNHILNCSSVNVLFIWRRNYVAHPRNPSGKIQRKIANEKELVQILKHNFPHYNVRGIQMEKFSMTRQVQTIGMYMF